MDVLQSGLKGAYIGSAYGLYDIACQLFSLFESVH